MKNKVFKILDNVICYHGYKRNEKPLSFLHQKRQWNIIEIIDRWYEGGNQPGRPVKSYFKVRTSNNTLFILCHNPEFDSWSVQLKTDQKID